MAYDIVHAGPSAEVRLAGALTFAAHRKFRSVVTSLNKSTPEQVVFDLSRVEHIDAAGLGLLLVARDTVAGGGGRAELKGARGDVGRLLAVARFHQLFQAA